MTYLTTTELADIRTAMEDTLPTTCSITYTTTVSDGMGGKTPTDVSRGATIACRLSPAEISSRAGISQERLQEGQVWVLSLHWDQTVAHGDKVTVGSNVYRVQQINADESEIFLKRVFVVRWV